MNKGNLAEHFNTLLPDFEFPNGLADLTFGTATAALGAGIVGTLAAPEILTASALIEVFAAVGLLSGGLGQAGVGVAELLGGPHVSSEEIEIIKELANPAFAGALGVGALSGGREGFEAFSKALHNLEMLEALGRLEEPAHFLEKLDAALKMIENAWSHDDVHNGDHDQDRNGTQSRDAGDSMNGREVDTNSHGDVADTAWS